MLSEPDGNAVQGTLQNRVITVGNTNPSGKGMNGNCYSSDGINPTLTCNKQEGNRVAVPVGNIYESKGQAGTVCDSESRGPCVPGFGAGGGGKEMKVAVPVDCIDSWNRPIEGVSNIPRRNAYSSKQRLQRPPESSDSGTYP